jgi:hypothetical protein
MEGGVGPPSSSTPGTRHSPAFSHDNYSPMRLLIRTLEYGKYTWEKINSLRKTDHILTPLLNLTHIIEDQLQNIIELHKLHQYNPSTLTNDINLILAFYSQPEIPANKLKHAPNNNIALQLLSRNHRPTHIQSSNLYNHLFQEDNDDIPHNPITMSQSTSSLTHSSQANTANKPSYFVEDLAVSEVSDIVRAQVLKDQNHMEIEEGIESTPLVPTTVNLTLETPILQRIRFNLIRHRFAKTSELSTLQLFKSFMGALRQADKHLNVLPCDSTKQHYTSLVSSKQIETLNDHQLHLYFHPWHKKQHYSLSGYLHLNTMMSFTELMTQTPVAEWLDTYQYSARLCPSQTEEMFIIGALCYGSTWLFREDLKLHIQQHPVWNEITQNQETLLFDLILRRFRSTTKTTMMIFVTAERSKQETVREAFKTIYDGTSKAYPRGEMLLFIPIKHGESYDQDKRNKYIFNHETYLGDEDVIAIHGLRDLNTEICLKGGLKTTIRMLLKSLPATQGMQRNRLFHIVDPNAGQTCTIATFQKQDKHFVEQRKLSLEQEIRSVLDKGEATKVFTDEIEGIWFGGTIKIKNGKPVSVQTQSRHELEFHKHSDSLLNSPPNKKRSTNDNPNQGNTDNPKPTVPNMVNTVTLPSTVTTPQPRAIPNYHPPFQSQILATAIDSRFTNLETEMYRQRDHQQGLDNRLTQLETKTTTIDDNIAQMMAFWNITPSNKRKATDDDPDETQPVHTNIANGNTLTPSATAASNRDITP